MLRQPEKQILPAHGLQASRKGAGQRFRLPDIAPALMRCMGFRCIEFALLIFRLKPLSPSDSLKNKKCRHSRVGGNLV